MHKVKLRKVGGSTAVALPPHVLAALSLGAGSVVSVGIVDGRVVLQPMSAHGRIGITARLAMCDFTQPYTEADRRKIDAWEQAPAVGREFGSPDWDAAEKAGKLDAFLTGNGPRKARKS